MLYRVLGDNGCFSPSHCYVHVCTCLCTMHACAPDVWRCLNPSVHMGEEPRGWQEGVILSSSPCCFEADSLVEHRCWGKPRALPPSSVLGNRRSITLTSSKIITCVCPLDTCGDKGSLLVSGKGCSSHWGILGIRFRLSGYTQVLWPVKLTPWSKLGYVIQS